MSNKKGEYIDPEGESLFDFDLGIEEETSTEQVIHGSSGRAVQLREAWHLWCDLTNRPDKSRMHHRFRTVYLDLLQKKWNHSEMMDVIRGAARMHPRPNDRHDIRRVVMPLTNYNHERTALALLREDAPTIRFSHVDTYTTKSTVSDLEDATFSRMMDWTENDIEASGILIRDHDEKELTNISKKIMMYLGAVTVQPVDVLRYRSVADSLKVTTRSDRGSYDAGEREAAQFLEVQDIDFSADRLATDMLLKGKSIPEIRTVHLSAPEGYWNRVNKILEDGDKTHKDAYRMLASKFKGWHPNSRKEGAGL